VCVCVCGLCEREAVVEAVRHGRRSQFHSAGENDQKSCLFCQVPLKREQLDREWRMRLTPNAIGCTNMNRRQAYQSFIQLGRMIKSQPYSNCT